MNDTYLTFTHHFRGGALCSVRVLDCPPESQTGLELQFDLSQFQPKQKYFEEYRRWILGVIQILADRWDTTITYVLRDQIWLIKSGSAPKLVGKFQTSR